ncbi:MAG: hypothetical protein ACYTGH_16730 [Planctomycetota bacterium]|jgi:DNA-binding NtrC family response regulator
MPRVDGLSAVERLQEENPQLRAIAISGNRFSGHPAAMQKSKQLGIAYAFTKPLDFDRFLLAIRQSLESS